MIRFKIYKNPSGVWLHQQIAANGELYKPFILGKFAVKFDGNFMKINEEGGSRRFYDDLNNVGMRYDEVQVFVDGVGETFGSVQQLAARLRDLFYPGFDYVASGEGLQMVTTENSDTVLFFGTGWPDNPLRATAIGGGGSVPNGFISLNPIIEDGNQRTFQAGETYNLAGELRTLAADYATTIATESEGVSRFDVVYALGNGTYGKAVGVAGEVAQIPDIPSGSLMRAIFAVNGSAINEQPPISSGSFVTKNSFNLISVTFNGLQTLLYGGTYVAQPGVTFISGFASPSAATTFYGQPIKIYNNTGGVLDLRHGQGLVQMDFVSGEDYTMQDQETATFWLDKDSNKLRLQSSSVRGGGGVPGLQAVSDVGNTTTNDISVKGFTSTLNSTFYDDFIVLKTELLGGNPYITLGDYDSLYSNTAIVIDPSSSEIIISAEKLFIASSASGSRGISSLTDFTDHITDLDFTQKKYVDDAIANAGGGGGITPEQLEERLEGILTPNAVETSSAVVGAFVFSEFLKNESDNFNVDEAGNVMANNVRAISIENYNSSFNVDEAGNVIANNLYTKSEVDSDFQSRAEKGVANGYASLDATGKVPISQISDALLGNVVYEGVWNATTNTPDLTTVRPKGQYFITDVSGTFNGVDFEVGDWIISNGTTWNKVDNTDAVILVAGLKGNITPEALRIALNIVDGVSQVAGLTGNISTAALKTALGVSSDVTKDLVSDHVDKNSVTGTAAQQVLSSVPIGEATGIRSIKPDSFLNVRTRFGKSGNQNGVEIKFYISTTAGTPGQPIPVGSQQIGRYSMTGATINIAGWQREYNINASGMFEGMAPNLSGLTDIMVTNSSPLAIQLTLPQQYYFITAVEVASPSAETITQKSIHITSSK